MRLTRAAFINAFLLPGLGHWTSGWRVTGALLMAAIVGAVLTPFGLFLRGTATRPDCWEGLGTCSKRLVAHAWSGSWRSLLVCVPLAVGVYAGALLHALRIRDPGGEG